MKLRRATVLLLCLAALSCAAARADGQTRAAQQPSSPAAATPTPERARYRIRIALDFDARTFNGTERVRWTNRDTRPTSTLYFHLYANVRGETNGPAAVEPFP